MTAKIELMSESTPKEQAMDILIGDGVLVEVSELRSISDTQNLFYARGRLNYANNQYNAEVVVEIANRSVVASII